MTTTALAVELVVIGYQALIWLALAVTLVFPSCGEPLLKILREWKELSLIGSLAAAYTLGAIVNGVASRLMSWIEAKLIFKKPQKPSEMRAAILVHEPEALKYVMTYFEAPRVLRSTILNIVLIGVFTTIHLAHLLTCGQLLILIACFILAFAGAVWSWYETDENFFFHLSKTYDAVAQSKQRGIENVSKS
jgi:hypothetical protein